MLLYKESTEKADYSARDAKGKVAFYVLLWKRNGVPLDLFFNYWRNVHGPVCARLPGQYQYWQFHVEHNQGGILPRLDGINYITPEDEQFDAIAELTFESEAERQTWFEASAILMNDEHNIFRKAIGYVSNPGNSITYVDRIQTGDPNGSLGILKFHTMIRKADGVSTEDFRNYLKNSFAPAVIQNDSVLKFRLHLFEEVDNTRPPAAGVDHAEDPSQNYQAAVEIAFLNNLEMEKFFASQEYATAVQNQANYIKQISLFPERASYTFVYNSEMTLAGKRTSHVAELITKIGSNHQLKEHIESLMVQQKLVDATAIDESKNWLLK